MWGTKCYGWCATAVLVRYWSPAVCWEQRRTIWFPCLKRRLGSAGNWRSRLEEWSPMGSVRSARPWPAPCRVFPTSSVTFISLGEAAKPIAAADLHAKKDRLWMPMDYSSRSAFRRFLTRLPASSKKGASCRTQPPPPRGTSRTDGN